MFRETTNCRQEKTVNESSMISNSFDPASPAPNQKREKGRMACTNATANASEDELTVYQPLGQVIQVNRDDHLMTVDGQDSETTVIRKLSKGRQPNRESKQSEISRATTSAKPPAQRQNNRDLRSRVAKVTQMSTLD